MNRTIVMTTGGSRHADAPIAAVANRARTSTSSAMSSSRSGSAPASRPNSLDGRFEQRGDAREPERPVKEAGDGHLVGGDQGRRRARTEPAGLAGDPERREPRLVRRAEVEASGSRAGRARAAGDGSRCGKVKAYWMGSRMSGVPSWAFREPSRKRTAEWTTLCGWMTTSMAS